MALRKGGKGGLVLYLCVLPTVHAVIEVDHGEGDVLEVGELGDLPGQSRVSGTGGRRHEIDVRDSGEVLGDLGEVASGNGVAEEENVGKMWVGVLRTHLPSPLDIFRDGSRYLGVETKGREQKRNDESSNGSEDRGTEPHQAVCC
jgi:hypothetical protein